MGEVRGQSADVSGKKRQGKKGKRGENWEEKKENCKREGGKLGKIGNRSRKSYKKRWGPPLFCFVLFFHFWKRRKLVLGLPKWEFSTGKKHFMPGKNIRKNDFVPSEKYVCYAPAYDQYHMVRTLWSWTIHSLKEFSKSNMLQDHIWNAHCSRTIFEMLTAYRSMFAMLLEQYAFQIWSWSIFDLENSLRLWMVEDHMVLMVQDHMVLDHKSRPKSHKSGETALHSTNGIVVDSPVKKQTRTWDILRSPSNLFSIKTTFIRDGATKLLKQYQ